MKFKLTNQTFEQQIMEYKGTALVTFYAVWCGKCSEMETLIEKMAEKHGENIKFAAVDIDESGLLAANYEIEVVPTYLLFKNGEMICRASGVLVEEELEELIHIAG